MTRLVRLSLLTSLLACSCKTTHQPAVSETKGIATQADIEVAHRLIGGDRSIGICKTSFTLRGPKGRQKLNLRFDGPRGQGQTPLRKTDFTFSNHEANRSRIDVIYGMLGYGEPKRIELERVDLAGINPSEKYIFTYTLLSGKVSQLEVVVMSGFQGNVKRRVNCL